MYKLVSLLFCGLCYKFLFPLSILICSLDWKFRTIKVKYKLRAVIIENELKFCATLKIFTAFS